MTPEEEVKRRKLEQGQAPEESSEDSDSSQALKNKMLLAKQKTITMPTEEEAMLARDNLKLKSIARYKTIMDGDLQCFQDIENQLIDMAMVKRKAFDDSSMEEYERAIESDLEERGLNNPDCYFGRRSDNSELLGSVNSSQDYWQRFEDKQKLHKYRGRSLIARNNANSVA